MVRTLCSYCQGPQFDLTRLTVWPPSPPKIRCVVSIALCSLEAGTESLIDVTPVLIADSKSGTKTGGGGRKLRNMAYSVERSGRMWLESLMYRGMWTEWQGPDDEDAKCQVMTARRD